jgi:hypothetical protein
MSWINEWQKNKNQTDNQNKKDHGNRLNGCLRAVESVHPMIERTLLELGNAIWGSRFRFTKSSDEIYFHWSWKIERKKRFLDGDTHNNISVTLISRDDSEYYFEIRSNRDYPFEEHVECLYISQGDYSEDALKKSLIDISSKQGWNPI